MRIHDVAKKLNLSVATVSRALNPLQAHLVTEKTRRKVEKFVNKVGYIPNRTARELSTGKTKTIGLVLPNVLESIFFNDYLIKVLAGVYHVLDQEMQYNCKIVILPRGKVLSQLDQHVFSSGIDGLLLSPYCDIALYGSQFPKQLLSKWDRPVVIMNLNTKHTRRFSGVYTDHYEACRQAIDYLIQKGHKQIGFIQGDVFFPEANMRLDGYNQALKDNGLRADPAMLAQGNFTQESGYEATISMLSTSRIRPTALFCANDEMAIGALRALKVLKIRCPQEIAVMGFDGIDIGGFVEPRLTTVVQPMREIAEISTRLILDLIEDRIKAPVLRSIPSTILPRESA